MYSIEVVLLGSDGTRQAWTSFQLEAEWRSQFRIREKGHARECCDVAVLLGVVNSESGAGCVGRCPGQRLCPPVPAVLVRRLAALLSGHGYQERPAAARLSSEWCRQIRAEDCKCTGRRWRAWIELVSALGLCL